MQWNDALEQSIDNEFKFDTSEAIRAPSLLRGLLWKCQSLWHDLWWGFSRREDGASIVLFVIVFMVLVGFARLAVTCG